MKIFVLLLPFLLPVNMQVQEQVEVEVVNIFVTARNSGGEFITDLKPEEFVVKEDGVVQKITHFTNFALEPSDRPGEKAVPLSLAFVMDTSASMKEKIDGSQKIDIVKNAAYNLLEELGEEDQMMLISFNESPSEITPLTRDRKRFERDLLFQDVKGGNTALLDSIYFALEKLKAVWGRKMIVVCSDGEDTASTLRFDEVLSNVVASDVTIVAFGTMAMNSSGMRGRYILQKMADASGGYAFFPSSVSALKNVMLQLRKGMRSQYFIGYRPQKKMDGTWRKIEILCLRPGVTLRYREGYFAADQD